MRILLVGPDRSVKGGITTVIEGILQSDLSLRHSFMHISTHRDDFSRFGKLLYGIQAYGRFLKAVYSFRPHLIHVHTSFGASFYRKSVIILLSRLLNIKQINHIHGAEFDRFYTDAGGLKKQHVKFIYNISDSTIVLSKSWMDKINEFCNRSRVFCLNNFAVLPDIEKISGENTYRERKPLILFLGKIGRRKGAFDLPEIVSKVCQVIEDARFVIAGNGEIEKVRNEIDKTGYGANVTFTGWIGAEQKKDFLLQARIYLLPSYYEGLPMSILEAMSYGLPIISTLAGGIPELVESGENGFLFKAGDVEGIARGIITLLQDEELSLQISIRNRVKIEKSYELNVFSKQLEEIYRITTEGG